jgi:hypothetical protein
MVTTGNNRPNPEGTGRLDPEDRRTDGDPAAQRPAAPDNQQENGDNAVLDEIETLLHELSSEYTAAVSKPAVAEPADRPEMPAAVAVPQIDSDTLRTSDFDLAKPVDYHADASRYDYRRAAETHQADAAVRTMARKLAPAQEIRQDEPPTINQQTVRASMPPPADPPLATGVPAPADREQDNDDQDSEKWAQRRRRLRLRPARRVPGSRPEAQFTAFANGSQEPDEEWDPRPSRRRTGGQNGQGAMIGAGITLLVIAGTTGAFALIDPLNRMLPDNVAALFGGGSGEVAVASLEESDTDDPVRLSSGKIVSGEALGLQQTKQSRADVPAGIAAGNGERGLEPAIASNPPDTAEPESAVTELDLKPAIPAEGLRTTTESAPETPLPAAPSRVASAEKSPERINQDSVVQAILQDPQKRALEPRDKDAGSEQAAADTGSDPITTGSINDPSADERIRGANAVARQAAASSAGRVSKRTLETRETVKVAGLAPEAPFSAIQGEPGTPPQPQVQSQAQPQMQQQADAPAQPKPQQVARVENTDLNGVDIGKTGSGRPESAAHGSSADGLLARGHELLKQGDIASARLLFRRVVAMGDWRGAEGMGMTYDPKVFRGLPVAGMSADIEQAEFWYRKAREFSAVQQAPDASGTDRMPVSGN